MVEKSNRLEKNLSSPSVGSIVANLTRTAIVAAIASIPKWGGPLSVLLCEYLPNRRLNRIEAFIRQFGEELTKLREQPQIEFATSEEYGELLDYIVRKVAQTRAEEKLDAYRNILLNAALGEIPDDYDRELVLARLDTMTTLHMQVFGLIAAMVLDNNSAAKNRLAEMPTKVSKIVFRAICSDLVRDGFLAPSGGRDVGKAIIQDRFDQLRGSVSKFGIRFRRFIMAPESSS